MARRVGTALLESALWGPGVTAGIPEQDRGSKPRVRSPQGPGCPTGPGSSGHQRATSRGPMIPSVTFKHPTAEPLELLFWAWLLRATARCPLRMAFGSIGLGSNPSLTPGS